MPSNQPLHTSCQFTGLRVCRCVHGNAVILASRSSTDLAPDEAEAYMRRARAAWRLLHHPDSPAFPGEEPAVLWLPRLEQRAAQPAHSPAVAAATARVQRAEASARTAAVYAASLAAAAGLPFRLPDQVQLQVGTVPLDLGGLPQAAHPELEQAVHRAQEAQQDATAAAPGAAPGLLASAPGALATPDVAPLPATAAAASSDGLLPPASSGRVVQRSRSVDAGLSGGVASQLAGARSLPVPSRAASGSAGVCARRSLASKPSTGPSSRGGPGTSSLGGTDAGRASPKGGQEGAVAGAGAPLLAPFGLGYEARGASAAAPLRDWLLTIRDFTPALQGAHIQILRPNNARWWPAVVLSLSLPARTCTLCYETGDEESADFPPLVHAGAVAWLRGPPAAAAPGASGSPQDAARSAPVQSGSCRPLSAGLRSPSQQSLHSTGQQQEEPLQLLSPPRQHVGGMPAEAVDKAAALTVEPAPGRAGSLPRDPTPRSTSPLAGDTLGGPLQSAEAGLSTNGSKEVDASSDGVAELRRTAGSRDRTASPGSELPLGTAAPPSPPPPPESTQQELGQLHGGVAAADAECAPPPVHGEREDDQQRLSSDGLPAEGDAPEAEHQVDQPEPVQPAVPAAQAEPAEQVKAVGNCSLAEQVQASPALDEPKTERLVAGPTEKRQSGLAAGMSSEVKGQQKLGAARAEHAEQTASALVTQQADEVAAGAAIQQELLPPWEQLRGLEAPAASKPSLEHQAGSQG